MDTKWACIVLLAFSAIGYVSCVASVFLPSWMAMNGKLYGIWDLCDSGVCATEGYRMSFLHAFHVVAGTSVALPCMAAILKVVWALRHFPSDYHMVLASTSDIIAGVAATLTYGLYTHLVPYSDISWAAVLCIMAAVLLVLSGVFGIVVKATDTSSQWSKKSGQVPLICMLQPQLFTGHDNSTFIYHNASLNDSASTDSDSGRHFNYNGSSVSHL